VIAPAVAELAEVTGTARACALLGRPRASHYRARHPPDHRPRLPRRPPPNTLTDAERAAVLAVCNSPRFVDKSVAQTWATLLDEGMYLASRSTMHRVLRAAGQSRERRRQARGWSPPTTSRICAAQAWPCAAGWMRWEGC